MNSNENISACTGITMNEKEVPHNPANEDYGLCSASIFSQAAEQSVDISRR